MAFGGKLLLLYELESNLYSSAFFMYGYYICGRAYIGKTAKYKQQEIMPCCLPDDQPLYTGIF